jgi:hypothetical protein
VSWAWGGSGSKDSTEAPPKRRSPAASLFTHLPPTSSRKFVATLGLEPLEIRILASDHYKVIAVEMDTTTTDLLDKVLSREVPSVDHVARAFREGAFLPLFGLLGQSVRGLEDDELGRNPSDTRARAGRREPENALMPFQMPSQNKIPKLPRSYRI